MNEKQWVFIYTKLKKFINEHSGSVPDEKTAADAMALYEYILRRTENTRAENGTVEEQITTVFNYLFLVIHSAEKVNKPL